jgi:hypothetical protein
MYSVETVYNFLRIVSNFEINRSKLPDGALYIAIMHALLALKWILMAHTSKYLSLQYFLGQFLHTLNFLAQICILVPFQIKFNSNWLLINDCQKMSTIILSGSYDALRDTVYVGKLNITDLTICLLSLSILLHFDGKQLRVPNHLVDKTIYF